MTLDQQCWQASGKYGPPTYTQDYDQMVLVMCECDVPAPQTISSEHADINHRAKVAALPKMMLHPKGAPRLVTKY